MQIFLDNFSVYGSKKDHMGQFFKCLDKCRRNGINLNPKKCAFCVNYSVFLGHIVCSDGLLVDPRKITIITTMQVLDNVTKIKRFLEAVGFYQCYFEILPAKQHLCANC